MPKKIVYSPYSKICLEQITLTIAEDSIKRAENFIDKILLKIEDLSTYPNLGKTIEDNVKKLVVHKNYIIYYRVEEKEILILSVKNSKEK